MLTPTHMQDQIHNRIEELMNEKKELESFDWDEVFQNVVTLSLIVLFMTLGLNW
ncbi:MAG: hypothetical protein L3J59_05105 [Methylococcaceae bacterium]|nr:hypothetical protein [Methylococcaceae bacterium]